MRLKARKYSISQNILFYSSLIVFILILYTSITYAKTEQLSFLLFPVAYIVEKVFNSPLYYQEGVGFVYESMSVIINKSCSGATFWMICFSMLSFSFSGKIKKIKDKYLFIIGSFALSYFLTLVANVSRIIMAIQLLRFKVSQTPQIERILHQWVGVLVYCVYLWGIYIVCLKLIKGGEENEEINKSN